MVLANDFGDVIGRISSASVLRRLSAETEKRSDMKNLV